MKKALSLLLALVLCLSLCACGTDEPDNTQNSIHGPGVDEETEISEVAKSSAAIAVEAAISELDEITVNSGDALEAVQSAYDALSSDEKNQVENYDVLVTAWATFSALQDQESATQLKAVIDALGSVSVNNRQRLVEAMKLYNETTDDIRALVSNTDVLLSAADSVSSTMLSQMAVESDFVRNMSFYYHTQFPRGNDYWYADERSFSLPYLGVDSSSVWLRWVCNYTASDWVFFKKITFACDDQRFYKNFSYFDVTRDNSGGKVWEYVDVEVGTTEIQILEAIANSTNTIIRYEGDDYYRDVTVTQKDKDAIRFMLDLYVLLGGK